MKLQDSIVHQSDAIPVCYSVFLACFRASTRTKLLRFTVLVSPCDRNSIGRCKVLRFPSDSDVCRHVQNSQLWAPGSGPVTGWRTRRNSAQSEHAEHRHTKLWPIARTSQAATQPVNARLQRAQSEGSSVWTIDLVVFSVIIKNAVVVGPSGFPSSVCPCCSLSSTPDS